MKVVEQVKTFVNTDLSEVEAEYNVWIVERRKEIDSNTILKGRQLNIYQRNLVIRNYEGEETFAIAVFYDAYSLDPHQKGTQDRAAGGSAASIFRNGQVR